MVKWFCFSRLSVGVPVRGGFHWKKEHKVREGTYLLVVGGEGVREREREVCGRWQAGGRGGFIG